MDSPEHGLKPERSADARPDVTFRNCGNPVAPSLGERSGRGGMNVGRRRNPLPVLCHEVRQTNRFGRLRVKTTRPVLDRDRGEK